MQNLNFASINSGLKSFEQIWGLYINLVVELIDSLQQYI